MIFAAQTAYTLAQPLTKPSIGSDSGHPEFTKACRNAYYLKLSEVYSIYLLQKDSEVEEPLCERYISYIESVSFCEDEHRDSKRVADKAQRQQLTDYCVGCNVETGLKAHHIIPHSAGGPTTVWNLAMLCKPCHRLIPDVQLTIYRNSAEMTVSEELLQNARTRVQNTLQQGDIN